MKLSSSVKSFELKAHPHLLMASWTRSRQHWVRLEIYLQRDRLRGARFGGEYRFDLPFCGRGRTSPPRDSRLRRLAAVREAISSVARGLFYRHPRRLVIGTFQWKIGAGSHFCRGVGAGCDHEPELAWGSTSKGCSTFGEGEGLGSWPGGPGCGPGGRPNSRFGADQSIRTGV